MAEAIDNPSVAHRTATGWFRAMDPASEGGGSQPHVFHTDGGDFVVKVANNPQGSRVLVNELVGGLCLDWLGVVHPQTALVDIPPEVIDDSPGAQFNDGTRLQAGLAFGSEYCLSDPGGAVDNSLITNLDDVAGTLVYDTWVKNHDGRQFRVRARTDEPGRYEFVPVDQGHSFGAPAWDEQKLRSEATDVQAGTPALSVDADDLSKFIDRLRQFSEADARQIVGQVPEDWLSAEESEAMAHYLSERARRAAGVLDKAYPTGEES